MYHRFCISVGYLLLITLSVFGQDDSRDPGTKYSDVALSDEESRSIETLVDQLVFTDADASSEPVFSPGVKDKSSEYAERYKKVQDAFGKLADLKIKAFPILIKHLDDKRQSINFRNHYLGNSVGDACYWNVYFQLQDRPRNYSKYGYQRSGRDGKSYPKPYWEGTPFDDAGGLAEWLEQNASLTYVEMQIKCLSWLLDGEKKIGASDAESYFVNILPLEIQILRRRIENGEDVKELLAKQEKLLQARDASMIPDGLLPDNAGRTKR
jgi:hypothetical protein